MSLEQDLKKLLLDSMKAKDQFTVGVVRMINSKITERRTAKGFTGEVDDAVVLEVITAYKKAMQKAREEFAAVGDKGATQVAELTAEIDFCDRFLPKGISADEIRAAVLAAIASTGAKDVKMAGRVVGEVMKAHKGKVEAGDVKKIAEEELAKLGG